MKETEKDKMLELFLKPVEIGSEVYKKMELLRETKFGGSKLEDLLIEWMEITKKQPSLSNTVKISNRNEKLGNG